MLWISQESDSHQFPWFFSLNHSSPHSVYSNTDSLLVIFLHKLDNYNTVSLEYDLEMEIFLLKENDLAFQCLSQILRVSKDSWKSQSAVVWLLYCSWYKLLLNMPSPVSSVEIFLNVINSYILKPGVERIPIIITTLSATIKTVNKWLWGCKRLVPVYSLSFAVKSNTAKGVFGNGCWKNWCLLGNGFVKEASMFNSTLSFLT